MKPERWQTIEKLYEAARRRDEIERDSFLSEACASDPELLREVQSLLRREGQAQDFLESPALEVAARQHSEEPAYSLPGKQVGTYRVLSLLGRGGMGEVYLAQDERLDRKVALKFLLGEYRQDQSARRRFLREARSAAALDHAFICHIHEIGEIDDTIFIAMEYVPGRRLDQRLAAPLAPRFYGWPRVSPEGRRIALENQESGNSDVWIFDLTLGTLRRLTFHPAIDGRPLWTPDGLRVVFTSNRDPEGFNIYWQASDGSGQPERLTVEPNQDRTAWSFTPDGKWLAFTEQHTETALDTHLLSIRPGFPSSPLLHDPVIEGSPAISPDGRWIAYRSFETGRSQVYVRPFPNIEAGKWEITQEGGYGPLWAPDGGELFYRIADSIMAVPIQTEPRFTPGRPRLLFTARMDHSLSRNYDISPDGRRFLMVKTVEPALEPSESDELIIVFNWFEELRRLVPAD